jgi:uncharacterized protein
MSKNNKYMSRIADAMLAEKLKTSGAVQIKGPKWCGKTSTAAKIAKSVLYMQDPDQSSNFVALAQSKPSMLLEGETPRLIDEWQMAPQLWDAVRFWLDKNGGRGKFILTGSSTPKDEYKPAHSGVGRIARLNMRTMSLFESGESNGSVPLSDLFEGETSIGAMVNFDIEHVAHAVCRGGWPEAITEKNEKVALKMAKNYVEELLDSDIPEMDGKNRNKNFMTQLLRSLARNISSEASLSTISADTETHSLSRATVSDYVDALTRACVIEDLQAWSPKLRSKTAIRTSPTHHFCDVSIACALLGATPEKLMYDFETFGLLFESLCVHDLRVYAESLGGGVWHYRDKTGLEADAVIELLDGRWALVEVKLGSAQIEAAATNLKKLAGRIDQKVHGKPSFLMVLTATNTAYTREDGVHVVPLACLKD